MTEAKKPFQSSRSRPTKASMRDSSTVGVIGPPTSRRDVGTRQCTRRSWACGSAGGAGRERALTLRVLRVDRQGGGRLRVRARYGFASAVGLDDEPGAVADGEFRVDVIEVGADGCFADEQSFGDGAVGQSLADEAGDLELGGRQAVPTVTWASSLSPPALRDRDGGVEVEIVGRPSNRGELVGAEVVFDEGDRAVAGLALGAATATCTRCAVVAPRPRRAVGRQLRSAPAPQRRPRGSPVRSRSAAPVLRCGWPARSCGRALRHGRGPHHRTRARRG